MSGDTVSLWMALSVMILPDQPSPLNRFPVVHHGFPQIRLRADAWRAHDHDAVNLLRFAV